MGRIAQLSDEEFLKEIRKLYIKFPDKIITASQTFDVVPVSSNMTVINQFWGTSNFVHIHDCFEIDYVFKGRCEFSFLDEKRMLQEGDFCIISPYISHNIVLQSKEAQVFPVLIKEKVFNKMFFPLLPEDNILSEFFKQILDKESEPNYLLFQTKDSLEIKDYMKRLFLENFYYDKYTDQNLAHWLHLLFSCILRNYKAYSQFSSYQSGIDYAPILRYIQNHYTTVTLQRLSEVFHYSIPYLSKVIKEYSDKNFITLVREIKMRESVRYLLDTELSMEEISEKIGYNSEDHFYRVFTAYHGISPLKYRKKYQE
ncbi:helix-turn-helix domain-containing protein [Mediterraneibacter faecis]|uniref:helix-turn-helix domain-containing protein n=1 Tax=Mediterraneibacter faecis TaxID=592978 RepID=UPI0015F31DA1|nr:helix-turn-helix domain-containing protein [Mediterraneibacter faecis]